MANTYSQLYIQFVFAVYQRECLISHAWEDRLYEYIAGMIRNKNQKPLAINGMPDHVHILVGMRPDMSPSDLMREVKKGSAKFVNDNRLSPFHFQWQEGFGAFSYGHSQLDTVVSYIRRQKEHHQKRTFKQEYLGFLNKFKVDFKEEYLFNWIENE